MEIQKLIEQLRYRVNKLETDLARKNSELLLEKQLKDDLLAHIEVTSKRHDGASENERIKTLEGKFQNLKVVHTKLQEEHIQLHRTKAEVDKQFVIAKQAKEECSKQINKLINEISKAEDILAGLWDSCLSECEEIIKHSINEIDNPALSASTSAPNYLKNLFRPTVASIIKLENYYIEYKEVGDEKIENLTRSIIQFASSIGNYIMLGKTTSNSSRDTEIKKKMVEMCKQVGANALSLVSEIKNQKSVQEIKEACKKVSDKINEFTVLIVLKLGNKSSEIENKQK